MRNHQSTQTDADAERSLRATGVEWLVEAYGCSPDCLRDPASLQALFAQLIRDLDLHPCGEGQWTQFDGEGGVTGFRVLAESHVACHSFPEHGTLCLNLFCCRPRPDWDFLRHLSDRLGARAVHIRRLERPYHGAPDPVQAGKASVPNE